MEQSEDKKQEIKDINPVLLLEDDALCYKFMTYYLNKIGCQVDLATNSFTAIQNIQNKTYGLIIADINLNGSISGKGVIHLIRENQLNIGTPLIVWSAYINKNNEEKYSSWGVDIALIKACTIEDLKKAIHQCSLMSRYEREYYYKLKAIEKIWTENSALMRVIL